MIAYEQDNSPFYVANRDYCKEIERQLAQFGYHYSGFCNAYGYEILTEFDRSGLTCRINYEKHQTTRDGVSVPIDANDYSGISIIVKGLRKDVNMVFGKGKMRRFFSNSGMKKTIPAPFFLSANKNIIQLLETSSIDFLIAYHVGSLKMKKGACSIKIHSALVNPIALIDEVKKRFSS